MKLKKIDDNSIRDMEGNYLEMLSIDDIIISKVNEIIEYLNEK